MTKSKKAIVFSLTSIGIGSVGTYFLWPISTTTQPHREEFEKPTPENLRPQEMPIDNSPSESASEVPELVVPIQEPAVEVGSASDQPVVNIFGTEGRKRKIELGEARPKVEVLRDYTIRVGASTG